MLPVLEEETLDTTRALVSGAYSQKHTHAQAHTLQKVITTNGDVHFTTTTLHAVHEERARTQRPVPQGSNSLEREGRNKGLGANEANRTKDGVNPSSYWGKGELPQPQ